MSASFPVSKNHQDMTILNCQVQAGVHSCLLTGMSAASFPVSEPTHTQQSGMAKCTQVSALFVCLLTCVPA